MGFSANPLTLGCDCLGEIYYFDGTVNDSRAMRSPSRTRSACTRRTTESPGSTPTSGPRRSRSAARAGWSISMICTVGNYEYGFFWYFYNDASMEVEVKLSGVLTTGAVRRRRAAAVGQAGRAQHLRPESPAFLQLPPRHERRRRGQQRLRGRLDPRARPGAEPAPQRVDHPGHAGGVRGRRCARLGLVDTARYWKIDQPVEEQRTRQPGRPTS